MGTKYTGMCQTFTSIRTRKPQRGEGKKNDNEDSVYKSNVAATLPISYAVFVNKLPTPFSFRLRGCINIPENEAEKETFPNFGTRDKKDKSILRAKKPTSGIANDNNKQRVKKKHSPFPNFAFSSPKSSS